MEKTILLFGDGYVTNFLSANLIKLGWSVYCTSRKIESNQIIYKKGLKIIHFQNPILSEILKSAQAVLSSVPPNNEIIDAVLQKYKNDFLKSDFQWIGYLSSTSVYGNHNGEWVDENTPCKAQNTKAIQRLTAEHQWLELYLKHNKPVHILRLSGIYGPNRNCLIDIKNGKDCTIIKNNQYFSRTHVADICQAIVASIHSPTPGEIYNVSDNEPAPLNVVHQFGAHILGSKPLKEIPFEQANLSKEALHFFNDNKKINSNKIANMLNIKWHYPTYREGLLEGCNLNNEN